VIDVGAHHGQFALFAHHQFPRAQIFCFEPLPQGQQIILQLLPEPAPVKLFGIALGSSATEGSVMHISGLDDSSSLLPITERCTTAFPGTEEITSVNVTVSRLNDVFRNHSLARPCLLKIDVQGYELEVLQGGDRILQDVDEVLVECSFTELYAGQALAGELIAHLWAAGFDLAGVFELKRDLAGRCLQADLLFKRRTGSSVSQLLSSST
jgi:FkbM family methyltransferase